MPTNIEIKAVLTNRTSVEAIAARLSDSGPEIIHQDDFFFRCDQARLKLRVFAPDRAELLRYERVDVADVRGRTIWSRPLLIPKSSSTSSPLPWGEAED